MTSFRQGILSIAQVILEVGKLAEETAGTLEQLHSALLSVTNLTTESLTGLAEILDVGQSLKTTAEQIGITFNQVGYSGPVELPYTAEVLPHRTLGRQAAGQVPRAAASIRPPDRPEQEVTPLLPEGRDQAEGEDFDGRVTRQVVPLEELETIEEE
jgi:hypothetical protein